MNINKMSNLYLLCKTTIIKPKTFKSFKNLFFPLCTICIGKIDNKIIE